MPEEIKNRIKQFRMVPAHELKDNSKNFRQHSANQKNAMTEMLKSIGFVGAAIARETPDGLVLIDGHMRKELSSEVPTLIVDLTDEEMNKILAVYDNLGDMATIDDKLLSELLADCDLKDMPDINHMLSALVDDMADSIQKEKKNDGPEGMELLPHEHYDYLVVLARNSNDWNVLCERLKLAPIKRRGKVGTCRATTADTLLSLLKEPDNA